jgi:hypothetical protein
VLGIRTAFGYTATCESSSASSLAKGSPTRFLPRGKNSLFGEPHRHDPVLESVQSPPEQQVQHAGPQ